MARNYDLSVRLRAAVEGLAEVQKLIGEIEDVGGATEEAAGRSRGLSDEIRRLEDQQKLIDNFRRTRQELSKTADELGEAQAEAQRLGKELGNTEKPTAKLKRDFENARTAVQRLKDEQIDQTLAMQKGRQELEKAGLSSKRLNDAQANVRQSMQRTTDEIEDLTRELKEARDQSAKPFKDPTDKLERGARTSGAAVDTLGSKIKRVAGIAIGSAAAFFGIREAVQGITGIVSVGGDFEILQKRLEALTGSAEAGEEAFAWIKDFTRNTPFQLDQVTDAFVRAKAFGLDPMDGTLQAIADQAAKTGGGMEALNGIVTALGQAYSKGKIQAEEMLQLVERGVPAWDLLAQATGRSVAELQKMTTAGELGRREIGLLIKALGESGAGAAAEQMTTLNGLISNAKDTFIDFLNTINEAGLLEYAKQQIKGLADALEEMRKSGDLADLAKRISDGIINVAESAKLIALGVRESVGALSLLAKGFVALKLAQVYTGLTRVAATMGGALTTGARSGATSTRLLVTALRALPWLAVIEGVTRTVVAYSKLREAQRELARSQRQGADIQAEAARRIKEFNEQTGLNAETLKDMIRLQDEGGVVLDDYTGKWRLATDELTDAEKAERALAEAQARSTAEVRALSDQIRELVEAFRSSRGAGDDLNKSIEELAESALSGGKKAVESLSLSLERLALEGAATREELAEGLGEYLEGLSNERFRAFGQLITAEMDRIESSTEGANNRLSFMATLLEATLVTAAKRAGVDVGEVLEGIDEATQEAIRGFADLANQIKLSGLEADQADKILKAGLKKTLSSLGSTEEVEAAIAAIKALGKEGVLTSGQVAVLTKAVQDQGRKIKEESDKARKSQEELGNQAGRTGRQVVDSMSQAADSVRDLGDAATDAERKIGDTATRARGIASGLAAFYNTVTANLVSLSQKAHDAFQNATGGQTALRGLDAYKSKLQEVEKQIQAMTHAVYVDRTGIIDWMKDTSLAASRVEADFYRQKIALEDLIGRLDEGGYAGRFMSSSIDDLSRRFDLLDDQDLSRLQSSIQRVQAEVDGLNDSLQDTISSLRQELASLEGDNEELERLRYQEQRLELEAQLQRARALGDRASIQAAQEALSLAQQAYNLRQKQARERSEEEARRAAEQAAAEERRRQEQEREQRERQAQDFGREDRQAANQNLQRPTQTIILQGPNGQSVPISTDNPDELLAVLEGLGRRVS